MARWRLSKSPTGRFAGLVNLVVMMAVVALVLIGVAVAVANADVGMPEAPRDLPDTGLPADRAMSPADVDALRFSMAPRGYRMGEVDEAMNRLRDELAGRDAEIERLRAPESGDTDADELADDADYDATALDAGADDLPTDESAAPSAPPHA
jgi:DivIVA domain-containing protein